MATSHSLRQFWIEYQQMTKATLDRTGTMLSSDGNFREWLLSCFDSDGDDVTRQIDSSSLGDVCNGDESDVKVNDKNNNSALDVAMDVSENGLDVKAVLDEFDSVFDAAGGRYVSGDRHSWSGPRTVVVPRCLGDGFGFTLRHLVIHPPDGTTSSTYIDDEDLYTDEYDQDESVQHSQASSLDSMDTIFVKHVRVGGPADIAGLEIGDRILSVNGESVTGNSYSQVISLIQSSDATLKLLVVPRHEDILQMAYQRSVYETSQESHRCSSGDYTSSPVYSQQGSYIRYTRSGSMPSSAASSEVVHSRVGTHDRYETGSVSSRHSSGSDLSSRLRYPTVDHRVCQEDRENHNITDIPSGTVGRYSTAATRQSRGDAGQDILPMREPLRDYSTNYKLDEQNIDVSVKQGLNSTIGSGSSSRVREDGPSLEKSTSRSPYALYYPPPSLIKKESSSDMDRGIASSSHVHIGSSVKPAPYSGPAPGNRHSRNVSDIVGYSSSRPYAYSSSRSNSSQDTNPSYSQDNVRNSGDNVWTMTKGHGKDSAAIRHPVKVEHQIGISGLFPRSQTISGLTHQSSNNNNASDWRPARPAVSVGSLPYEGQTRSTIEVEPHPDKRNSGRFYGGVSTRSLLNRQLETDNTEPGSHTSQRYTPVLSPRSVLLNSNSNPCSPTRQPSLGGKGREELPSEQLSPARTLVVRISERGGKQQGDSPIVHTVTDQPHLMRSNQFSVATSNAYPAGTAFAVTRTQDGVKIDAYSNQKASPASITERKKRFEAGKENVSGGSHDISDMGKRYKTELRKLQSLGKLESVSKNMAHFESFSDSHESSPSSGTDERQSDANDNDSSKIFHITSQQILGQSVPLQSDNTLNMNRTKLQNRRVETQHSDMREQRQDLALVMPASVQERRLNEASQISALQSQSHAHPVETYAIQPAVKVRRIGAERYEYPESTISQRNDTETPKIPTTVPVRVIVPPSASNFSAPVSKFEQDGQPISHSTTSSQPQQYYPQYPPPNSTTSSTSQLSLYSSAPVHPSRHRNRDVMVFTPDSKPLTGSPYIHYMSTTPPDILDGAVTSRLIQPPDRKVTYATPVATPLGKSIASIYPHKPPSSASSAITSTSHSLPSSLCFSSIPSVTVASASAAPPIHTQAPLSALGSSTFTPKPLVFSVIPGVSIKPVSTTPVPFVPFTNTSPIHSSVMAPCAGLSQAVSTIATTVPISNLAATTIANPQFHSPSPRISASDSHVSSAPEVLMTTVSTPVTTRPPPSPSPVATGRRRTRLSFGSGATSGLMSVFTTITAVMSSHEAEKQKLSASEVVTVTTSSMTVTTVMATMATAATTILTAVSGTLGSSGSMPLPPPYTVSYSMAPASTMAPMYSADGIPVVMMRRRPPEECVFVADDDSLKLSRRTSYLMATSKDRTNLNLPVNQTAAAAAAASSVQSSEQQQLSISPKGVAGKKWKPMFGDKRISEQPEMPGDSDFSSSPMMEVVKQGWLYCKTSMLDGKRCSDRSWKLVWAVLRGHALYLSKEKRDSLGSFTLEEQPISIKSSVVDIANHYTKRKHVFGLQTYNGSEYLFQADGPEVMTAWIEAIQTHNDPDGDDQGVLVSDLIVRRSAQQQSQEPHTPPPQTVQQQTGTTTGLQVKTSPVAMHKSLKKSAAMTLKSKIPYSPSLRRKHKGDKDEFGKPKDLKEQKTWKDKLGKSLRRFGSGTSSATTPGGTAIADDELPTATFGVPLYLCMPSPCSDYVPLIIEICTRLVEVRGLEVVGIYRVPGNTAAVTLMQEEINRGVEHINSDNDRWFDVNVIGSLLKAFIRKLPDPIITDELYESFIRANRVENPIRRMLSLKRLLHELPEHNFETFHHLARHLQLVASYSNMNKMDARNLAIVFGPTLIRRKEGDMATMVADMSDQCRIIESLIHHNEWFFGSWDMDSHVPIANDEGEATPLTRLVRDDDDERDRDVDPKEIVTSIIQAASRKMQGKMTQDDIAISATDFQMRERNIDLEISRRKAKSHEFLSQDVIVKTVQMTSMSKSYDARDSTGQVTPPPPPLPPRISSVPAKSTSMHSVPVDDVDDWVFVRSHSESVPAHIGHDPASQGFVRRMSDDSLADKNDELEISHGSIGAGYSLSRDTVDRLKVDRLKRIELEARGLREREEQRQRDCEKHRIEQHRIEQELQRTKRELELEDGHSLDDLIRQTEFTQQISDFSQQLSEAGSKKNVSRSLMTSTGNIQGLVSGLGVLPTVTVTGRTVGIAGKVYSSTASSGTAADKQSESAIGEKYRYFVSIGNSRISRDKDHSKDDPVHKISAEYLESMGKRVGSLETIVDSNGKVTTPHKKSIRHPGARSRHDKGKPSEHSNNRSDHLGMGSRASLTRSNSGRRGSLDSLRDFYDKPDNRLSWVSTDSEDGSDLLADLTTTFDRKLQILLNPKFRLDGNLRRQNSNKADESDNVSTASDAKDTKELKTEPPPKAVTATTVFQKPFEPIFQKPTGQESSRTGGPFERLFRDPSLHRTYKPEPIIGIASRFERGIAVPSTHVHTGTALLQNIQHVTQTAGQNSYNTLTDGTTDISSSSSSTAVTAPQSRNKNVSHNYSSNACSNTSNITASNNTANASNADYKPSTTTSHPNVDLKFVYSLPSVVQRCLEEEYDPVPYRDFGNVHTTTCNSVVQEIPRDSMSPSVSTSDRHAENHERNRDSLTKKQEFSMKHDEKLSSITDKKQKSDSYSPTDSRVTQKQHEISAQRRKRSERENRRHTVGGIDDAEHFKALIALSKTQAKTDSATRLSAWDQLQAQGVKGSLLSWLQNERLRSSTSNLTSRSSSIRNLSSSCGNLAES